MVNYMVVHSSLSWLPPPAPSPRSLRHSYSGPWHSEPVARGGHLACLEFGRIELVLLVRGTQTYKNGQESLGTKLTTVSASNNLPFKDYS